MTDTSPLWVAIIGAYIEITTLAAFLIGLGFKAYQGIMNHLTEIAERTARIEVRQNERKEE